MHVLMVAAENDALQDGKVGGVADVVRDVPPALVTHPSFQGDVTVVVPSYGFLHEPAAAKLAEITFRFRGQTLTAEVFEVIGRRPCERVRQLVLHHPLLANRDSRTGKLRIYVNDAGDAPFATDASRFALFNAAVLEGLHLGVFGPVDVLHLHDWHTGLIPALRRFNDRYASLRTMRTVFTIHNLALQGIRPVSDDDSAFESWFPDLNYEATVIGDPEYPGCVNPMACGIRLSQRVHVVSPSYATEVCEPSRPHRNDPECVFFGGEGLETDLQAARDDGRLFGILNGCEYPETRTFPQHDEAAWQRLLKTLTREVEHWESKQPHRRHQLALSRLADLRDQPRPSVVMTSVTRVVDQKVRLMCKPSGPSPIERLLARSSRDAVYLLAGTGDADYEQLFADLAELYPNLIYLSGFSLKGADALYEEGDLFLMPSAFEPCGISQMQAMRVGQPCVVHAIGGLKDTVINAQTGFSFSGTTPEELGIAFVDTTLRAMRLKQSSPATFESIRRAAFDVNFLWSDSMQRYLTDLYRT